MKRSIKINAVLNIIKQVLQILFPIITVPYITRVLQPEYYGKINAGHSIISYISLLAGLGVSSYAIREGSLVRNDRTLLNKFSSQVFSINIISTIISYAVLAGIILFVPHYKEYSILLIIQGMSIIFTTIGADWVNSIEEDYLYLTIRYILFHVLSIILMFLFVKKPEDYYIYAGITLITSVGANLMNVFYIRRYVRIRFTLRIDWKKHLIPILILFSNTIAITIYVSSDITMLEIFKGTKEVGVYSVSTKIYTVVKQVLNAILIVSIPRMTSYIGSQDQEKFKSLGKKILNAMITLMSPLVVGIIVFRNEAILVAGGNEYIDGVESLLVLSIAIAASLIATFYSGCVLMPLKKEKYILKGTLISAIINVGLNIVLLPIWGGVGAATTTLISEVFVAIYFFYLSNREGYNFIDYKVVLLSLTGGVMVALACFVIKCAFDDFMIYFSLSLVVSAIIYTAIQIVGKNSVMDDLRVRIKK